MKILNHFEYILHKIKPEKLQRESEFTDSQSKVLFTKISELTYLNSLGLVYLWYFILLVFLWFNTYSQSNSL